MTRLIRSSCCIFFGLIFLLWSSYSNNISAQQTEHYGIWSESIELVNPACAGKEEMTNYILNYRSQWLQLEGTPLTANLYIASTIPALNSGVALFFRNESIGNRMFNEIGIHYNYSILRKSQSRWQIGISAARESFSLDFNNVRPSEGGPAIEDERLLQLRNAVNFYNMGIGSYFTHNNLEVGLTSRQVIRLEGSNSVGYETNQELFLNLSYRFTLNKSIEIKPYSVFYSNFKHSQVYFGIESEVNNQFYSSFGIRGDGSTIESLGVAVGWKLNKMLSIKYQYEIGLNELSSQFAGSHEIMLTGQLGKSLGRLIAQPPIYSPRAL